jgi:hypothetical protein
VFALAHLATIQVFLESYNSGLGGLFTILPTHCFSFMNSHFSPNLRDITVICCSCAYSRLFIYITLYNTDIKTLLLGYLFLVVFKMVYKVFILTDVICYVSMSASIAYRCDYSMTYFYLWRIRELCVRVSSQVTFLKSKCIPVCHCLRTKFFSS